MKKTLLIFFSIIIGLTALICAFQAQEKIEPRLDPRLIGLESLITKIMNDWNVPGCAVSIVEKDKVLFIGGFGCISLKSQIPVDEKTMFPIDSCTKAFTSSLIGILADEGKIDIDKPANNYLPLLRFSDPLLTMMATPRDMMTHRTGIPRHDNALHGFLKASRNDLVRQIQYFQKSAELRQKFQYNNYMYMALGAMAEYVEGGKTWEEQIKERFFIPLEMNSTFASTEETGKIENKAYPHAVTFEMKLMEIPISSPDKMGPCGSIQSNAVDITHWLFTWINGGKYKNKVIIPENFYKQAITAQWGSASSPSGNIQSFGYGFGWNVALYQGHYSVYHGGSSNGFASVVLFLPSDDIGIAVFINSRTSPVPMIIANFITDRLLNLSYTDWSGSQLQEFKDQLQQLKKEFDSKESAELNPSHKLDAYCGDYINPGYGKLSVFMKENSLSGEYGNLQVLFKHVNCDAFKAIFYRSEDLLGKIDLINRPAVFKQNSKGEIVELAILLERAVDPIIFKKEVKR